MNRKPKNPNAVLSFFLALGVGLAIIGGYAACSIESTPTTPDVVTVPEPVPAETVEPEATEAERPAPKVEMTPGQANALDKAKDYLDYSAFSKSGLIKQLEYEGFSKADATFGAGHVRVDWNEQAAKAAKDYLEYDSFSKSGLIKQLEYEGFTAAQAKHGAKMAGL